jgi:hypothetical protein
MGPKNPWEAQKAEPRQGQLEIAPVQGYNIPPIVRGKALHCYKNRALLQKCVLYPVNLKK